MVLKQPPFRKAFFMVLYIGSLILGNIDVHFQYRHTRDRYVPLTELGEGMAGWYRALIVHYETLVETGNISHSNAEANLYEAFKVLGGQGIIDYLTRIGLRPIPPLPPVQGPCYPPPRPAHNEISPRRNGDTCRHCGSIWITRGFSGGRCNDCSGFL